MKISEKEINDMKSLILEFLGVFVDAAVEKGEKTVIVSPLNLNIDYEKAEANKEELNNLVNDLKNNYKKDGYVLDKCTISNRYNNGHELLFPTFHFSATIVKIEDDNIDK